MTAELEAQSILSKREYDVHLGDDNQHLSTTDRRTLCIKYADDTDESNDLSQQTQTFSVRAGYTYDNTKNLWDYEAAGFRLLDIVSSEPGAVNTYQKGTCPQSLTQQSWMLFLLHDTTTISPAHPTDYPGSTAADLHKIVLEGEKAVNFIRYAQIDKVTKKVVSYTDWVSLNQETQLVERREITW